MCSTYRTFVRSQKLVTSLCVYRAYNDRSQEHNAIEPPLQNNQTVTCSCILFQRHSSRRHNVLNVYVTTSLHCCVSYTGCQSRDEWSSRLCLVHQSLASLAQTYLTTDIHLVSEYGRRLLHSSTDRTLTVPRTTSDLVTKALLLQDLVCGTVCR